MLIIIPIINAIINARINAYRTFFSINKNKAIKSINFSSVLKDFSSKINNANKTNDTMHIIKIRKSLRN
jgi:hypothetical protein